MAIQLKEENLFATGYLVKFPEGDTMLFRDEVIYQPSAEKDRIHIVKQGDTIYGISYRWYGSDLWWHVIADVNKIYNPFELDLGLELIIPDLDVIRALRK